jgi:hypothetical protein
LALLHDSRDFDNIATTAKKLKIMNALFLNSKGVQKAT